VSEKGHGSKRDLFFFSWGESWKKRGERGIAALVRMPSFTGRGGGEEECSIRGREGEDEMDISFSSLEEEIPGKTFLSGAVWMERMFRCSMEKGERGGGENSRFQSCMLRVYLW